MKLTDKIEIVSLDEVSQKIAEQVALLDSLLATIQAVSERNNRNLALFQFGYRTLGELERARTHIGGFNSELAWSVRNLYELHLSLRYVLLSEGNLNEWLGQLVADERDIIQGFLILGKKFSAETTAELKTRLSNAEKVCQAHGIQESRAWRISDLAKATGTVDEYRIFYKFYSKFVHPSSWLVNGSVERTNTPMYEGMLIGLAQIFAGRNHRILLDEFMLKDDQLLSKAKAVPWKAVS